MTFGLLNPLARIHVLRVGWLFCAIGLPVLLGNFATQYAVAALLARRPALPAGKRWRGWRVGPRSSV